jgi:hypothetical protein
VTWAMVLRHLFGPVILPVYGLAAAGLLWLNGNKNDTGCSHCGSDGDGCSSCHAEAAASPTAKLAPPSMCGGSCGSSGGGGCGSGGCGKSGGGCGSGCGGGAKKSTTANAKGVANVNIPPPRAKMNPVPPAAANLPGLNGPNARPLPAGVVPNAAAAMPAGVAPAESVEQSAKSVESAAPANPLPAPASPVDGGQKPGGSVQTPSSMPLAPGQPAPAAPTAAAKGEVIKIPLPSPATPATPVAAPVAAEPPK